LVVIATIVVPKALLRPATRTGREATNLFYPLLPERRPPETPLLRCAAGGERDGSRLPLDSLLAPITDERKPFP